MSDKSNKANFSEMQLSAIAETQNISMGAAATAISTLLNAKVWITAPKVKMSKYKDLKHTDLMPSVCVSVKYVEGVFGNNVMILKQDDMQLILNQLMGKPIEKSEDFVFDELNMSAVCEIMNQMMGSAATSLSEFLEMPINISTPQASVEEEECLKEYGEKDPEDDAIEITFDITIDGVIKSQFVSILEIDLATKLANSMLKNYDAQDSGEEKVIEAKDPEEKVQQQANEQPQAPEQPAPAVQQPQEESIQASQPQPATPVAPEQPAQPVYDNQFGQQQPMYNNPNPQQQPQAPQSQQQPQQYAQPMYAGQPQQPYGQPMYNGQPQYAQPMMQQPINVQNVKLHQFDNGNNQAISGDNSNNLNLLMNVPLGISIELGSAKKKVKDILEFSQGSIIELDRQAGAPVDVVVNGQLIAKGDVVVIDDNFAVRITEILKSKLLDTLWDKE